MVTKAPHESGRGKVTNSLGALLEHPRAAGIADKRVRVRATVAHPSLEGVIRRSRGVSIGGWFDQGSGGVVRL